MATKKQTAKKTSAKVAKASPIAEVTKQQRAALTFVNESIDNAQDLAKKTYLASLGAVGRSYEEIKSRYVKTNEEIQARYEQINHDSQEFVKDLVGRGEKVQDGASELIKESRETVEEQIESAKQRLTGFASMIDIPARLQDVSDKLEALSKDIKKSA